MPSYSTPTNIILISLTLLFSAAIGVNGFLQSSSSRCRHDHARGTLFNSANNNEVVASSEAERLLSKAKAIREELGESTNEQVASSSVIQAQTEFCLPARSTSSSNSANNNYRLYLDIGREPGTWMDPRWGASGRRIECTIDISFSSINDASDDDEEVPSEDILTGLKKTVTSKSSKCSSIFKLEHAPNARLRSGFDKMTINEGGYCIESAPKSSTMRFCLSVSGTGNNNSSASYGDVSIPQGNLYFALPYFGTVQSSSDSNSPSLSISRKEGTICVKQFGWNTGWRREESRILGVFRAVPLEEARRRDKF